MDSDRIADRIALQELKARYFRYLDTKQWGEWRKLFTDGLVFFMEDSALPATTEPVSVGADEFVQSVSALLTGSVTVHQGHMPEIEFVDASHARGVWAMFDWVDNPGTGLAIQGFGHYHERYEKGDDGHWRIAELRLTRLRVDQLEPTHPAGARPTPPAWTRPA